MKITRAGTTPSTKGPEDYFTGTVRLDRLFAAETPGRVQGAATRTVTVPPQGALQHREASLGRTQTPHRATLSLAVARGLLKPP